MTTNCDSCEGITTITLEPYGHSYMAMINCPNCGVSFDTNLDLADIESLKRKSLPIILKDLEAHLSLVDDDMRDAGDESNPIIFAESGPNRFNLMSLFFNDSDGVRIQEDLELNEISVQLFNDYTNIELTEGALFEWAITYYKENY